MRFIMSFLLELIELATRVLIELLRLSVMLLIATVRLGGWLLTEVGFPGVRGLAGAAIAMLNSAANRRDHDRRRR